MDSYTFRVQRERERVLAEWAPVPRRRLGPDLAEHVCGFLALPGREAPDDVLRECCEKVGAEASYERLVRAPKTGAKDDHGCWLRRTNRDTCAGWAVLDYMSVTRRGAWPGDYLGEEDARMALALGERPALVPSARMCRTGRRSTVSTRW